MVCTTFGIFIANTNLTSKDQNYTNEVQTNIVVLNARTFS